ncbi:hypothetical protein RF55_14857 [Lasius niger]|uniref:Uncharacterized protein n=1 Tax=Lasius niger TaxID=67767 RepID=A0A0J7N0Q0_LASNI|nr:hypothetical protein RF55_14857 [Lasius niger]
MSHWSNRALVGLVNLGGSNSMGVGFHGSSWNATRFFGASSESHGGLTGPGDRGKISGHERQDNTAGSLTRQVESSALEAGTPRLTTTEAYTATAESLDDVGHSSAQIYESEGDLGGPTPAVAAPSLADKVRHQDSAAGARAPGNTGDYANTTRRSSYAIGQRLGADHPDSCDADRGRGRPSHTRGLTQLHAIRYTTSVAASAFRTDQTSQTFPVI